MLLNIGIAALIFVVTYLAGVYIKPLGKVYSFVFFLIGKPLSRVEQLFEEFHAKRSKQETKHPGLRTIMMIVILFLALAALTAETYNTLQALTALWGDVGITLPVLPSFVNYAMGALFLSIPAIFGTIWLECKKVVLEDVRMFTVPQEYTKKFERFSILSFSLSLVTSIAFYALILPGLVCCLTAY